MKKIIKLMTAAAVLLTTLIMTGCDPAIKEQFEGPKDKWLEKEVTWKDSNEQEKGKGTAYLYYTDNENPSIAELNNDIKLKKGLNIVFIPEKPKGETASTLYTTFKNAANNGDIPYTFFNIPKDKDISVSANEIDESVDTSSTGNSFKIKMTDAKWTLICTANPTMKNTATETVPYALKSSNFSQVNLDDAEIKKLFSWRQLLIMLLQE